MRGFMAGALLLVLVLLTGCGGMTAEEKLVGTWEMDGPGARIEFREDGTWDFPLEGESGTWTLSEGETTMLTIYDSDGNEEGTAELTFEGDDSFSMVMEGRPMVMNRVEE